MFCMLFTKAAGCHVAGFKLPDFVADRCAPKGSQFCQCIHKMSMVKYTVDPGVCRGLKCAYSGRMLAAWLTPTKKYQLNDELLFGGRLN